MKPSPPATCPNIPAKAPLRRAPHSARMSSSWRSTANSNLSTLLLLVLVSVSHVCRASSLDYRTPSVDLIPSSLAPIFDTSTAPKAGRLFHTSTNGIHSLDRRQSTSAFPRPFDTTIGNNFTAPTCSTFFTALVQDARLAQCHSVSLLLLTSTSFFQISKSLVRLTQTLDTACGANLNQCSNISLNLAADLRLDRNCGADLKAQNPLVLQAYNGLMAYEPVYKATCLKDASSSNYCFAEAMTNRSSPTSSYVYYLPLGTQLPGGAMPTCNKCLKNTMQGYASFAGNGSQPASQTYGQAVQQIDLICGPTFVNATVPVVRGASTILQTPPLLLTLGLAFATFWMS